MSRILKSIALSTAVSLPFLTLALPSSAQVQWKTPPSLNDDSIPLKAREEGLSGQATVSCTATAQGIIDNCHIENETPEGYGFGQAAITILQSGALHPSEDGEAIAAFRTRIPFNVEELPPPAPIRSPEWERAPRPTANDYPQRAINAGVSGGAAITCIAATSGIPENCQVLQEKPEGYGFGEAALKIVKRGRLREGDWLPGGSFVVVIPFSIH